MLDIIFLIVASVACGISAYYAYDSWKSYRKLKKLYDYMIKGE